MRTTTIRAATAAITIAAGVMLPSFADKTLNDGLAIYLPFNGDTANKSTSASAVQQAPELSPSCATITANGFFGQYLNITTNATAYGYLKLPGTDTGSLAYPNNKTFSAILWVRLGVTQNVDPIVFGNNGWGGNEKGFVMASANSSKKQVNIHAADGSNRFDKYFDWEASNIWTFYAVVCDNGSFRAYQGKSAGVNTLTKQTASLPNFTLATGYPFYIGQGGTGTYGTSNGRYFVGAVDDFALWTRALSEEDIQRIYECGRTGMELGELLKIDANDAPTMEITASDNDSATLAFGGRRNNAYTLFVAYGPSDAREDKYAWSGFMPVADIAAGTTEYTYTFPNLFKADDTRYRFFLMQTNNLPYIKEVEYAHSDGTAYFDSGIAPRRNLIAEFNVYLTADNGQYQNFFGAFTLDGDKKSNYGMCRLNSKWDREYNTGVGSGSPYQITGSCALNTDYHVVFTATNLFVNGVDTSGGGGITQGQFVEGGTPTINLFRNEKLKSNGTLVTYDQTMAGYYKDFSLYTPERTARDFRPVVDSLGTVGMFDRVTGEFYESAATALTAGADRDATRCGWVRAVSDAGLVVGDTSPDTALYTGSGADPANLVDPANWTCWNSFGGVIPNSVPTDVTTVTISGETTFANVSDTMPTYRSIKFDNVVLVGDSVWRGLDFSIVTSDSVVDLRGRTLTLGGFDGEVTMPFLITNTLVGAANTATLRIEVNGGTNFVNSAIAIGGNIKVAKDGDGIYAAVKSGQTYTGGTDVTAGTVRLGAEVTSCLGTGTVTVGSGTTFDLYGKDASACTMILSGGTITCSTGANSTLPLYLTQTADSRITYQNITGTHDMYMHGSEWNLGGYTLTLKLDGKDPDIYIQKTGTTTTALTTISNGTLKVEVPSTAVNSSGRANYAWVHIAMLNGKDGLNLDLGKSSLRTEAATGNSSVYGFTATPAQGDVKSTKIMEVYGTYLPASAYGFNMMMMDGSTVDLSQRTGAWNSRFSNTQNHQDANPKVSFTTNATITVDLHGRDDLKSLAKSASPYVITWGVVPPDTATFVLDSATQELGFKCKVTDEGLKLLRPNGLTIIIK